MTDTASLTAEDLGEYIRQTKGWKEARKRLDEAGKRYAERPITVTVTKSSEIELEPYCPPMIVKLMVTPIRKNGIPKVEFIINEVAAFYGFSTVELQSERRFDPLCQAKHAAMYLAKIMTGRSFPDIGKRFGGRDHTTVMHGVKKVKDKIALDGDFADEIKILEQHIRGRCS